MTTKRKRLLGGALAACVLLGATGALVVRLRAHAFHLPAAESFPGRPEAFNALLKAEREKVAKGAAGTEALRDLAHLYQANRLSDEAQACYDRIGQSEGGLNAHDHYYEAAIAEDRGELDRAERELRDVVALAPEYLPARLSLSDVLFKSGQPEAAEKEYLAILSLSPNQPQAMFGLARIDLQKPDDAAAIAWLLALMASHPEMTSGAALLAQVFDRRGETQRAAAMTQWSRQKPEPVPPDPWSDALLADCYDMQRLGLKFEEYFASGEIDQALPLLQRVEELDPKSSIPPLLRGWTQARDHNDAGAVKEYREALDKGGDPEKICPYMVQSLLALGQLPEAARLLAEFSAKKPDSIPILIAYADVAVKEGDIPLAKSLLTKVLAREPFLYSANMELARILWTAGLKDEAVPCLERAAKVAARDVPSRALLGQYYLERADPAAAIEPLEQAVASGSANAGALKSLGGMLYGAYLQAGAAAQEKGPPSPAVIGYYDKAIALLPGEAAAYAAKAGACAGLGQFRAAAEALGKLQNLQPGNATVYLSLGDVLYQDGQEDAARRNWLKAQQLAAPGDAALSGALAKRLNEPITGETFR